MAHSYVSAYYHCVFSTKGRRPWIKPELEERLWPYMGGIARENKMRALTVGGVADHVHMLLSIPSTLSISKAMQLIKGGSSKWVHDEFPSMGHFAWQEGYGAFSIGVPQIDDTKQYKPIKKSITARSRSRRNSSLFRSDMGWSGIRSTFGIEERVTVSGLHSAVPTGLRLCCRPPSQR